MFRQHLPENMKRSSLGRTLTTGSSSGLVLYVLARYTQSSQYCRARNAVETTAAKAGDGEHGRIRRVNTADRPDQITAQIISLCNNGRESDRNRGR